MANQENGQIVSTGTPKPAYVGEIWQGRMAFESNHGRGHTAADGHSGGQTHSSLMRNHLRLPSFLPPLPSITSSTYPAAAAATTGGGGWTC